MDMIRRPSSSSSTISKIFFSETTWPIKLKFYVEPPCVAAFKFDRKIHVTWPIWPPRPYMVKTTQKSSPEPAGRFPRNLVFTISDSSPLTFDKMMTLG